MILGAFGDSFIWGSDLADCSDGYNDVYPCHSSKTWTALLAKNLGMDYYCRALPGQGNKIIADDVIQTIATKGNSVFYWVNWTWIDRYDYVGHQPYLAQVVKQNFVEEGWCTLRPDSSCTRGKFYYKHLHSELETKFSNLMCVYTTLRLLQEADCKFIMTYMDPILFDKKWHCPASVDHIQNKVKKYCSTFDGKNFLNWSKEQNFCISNNWHPLEDAHQAAAEYWLPKVRTLLNSSAKEESHAFK